MSTPRRSRIVLSLVSIVTVFALSAQAEDQTSRRRKTRTSRRCRRPAGFLYAPDKPEAAGRRTDATHEGACRSAISAETFTHGREAWEGGRCVDEAHNGRYGWWWDVGGVWYFYPQPMDGPPA